MVVGANLVVTYKTFFQFLFVTVSALLFHNLVRVLKFVQWVLQNVGESVGIIFQTITNVCSLQSQFHNWKIILLGSWPKCRTSVNLPHIWDRYVQNFILIHVSYNCSVALNGISKSAKSQNMPNSNHLLISFHWCPILANCHSMAFTLPARCLVYRKNFFFLLCQWSDTFEFSL